MWIIRVAELPSVSERAVHSSYHEGFFANVNQFVCVLNYTHHTLVAGYYDFTLAIRVSVRPSVRPTIVRTTVRPHFVSDI